jgi:hypothetical protein
VSQRQVAILLFVLALVVFMVLWWVMTHPYG